MSYCAYNLMQWNCLFLRCIAVLCRCRLCYRRSSVVCRSVCPSVCHSREPCKKRLNRLRCRFGRTWTWMGHMKHVLNGVWAQIGTTWRMQLNRPCAAAMRPYVRLLWALVSHYHWGFEANLIEADNSLTVLLKPNSITLASSELDPNMFEAGSCQIPLH